MAKLRKCQFCGESVALEQRPSYWKIGHMCNDGAAYVCVIDEDPEKAAAIWNGQYAINYKPELKINISNMNMEDQNES